MQNHVLINENMNAMGRLVDDMPYIGIIVAISRTHYKAWYIQLCAGLISDHWFRIPLQHLVVDFWREERKFLCIPIAQDRNVLFLWFISYSVVAYVTSYGLRLKYHWYDLRYQHKVKSLVFGSCISNRQTSFYENGVPLSDWTQMVLFQNK